jgi:ribosome-associated protein
MPPAEPKPRATRVAKPKSAPKSPPPAVKAKAATADAAAPKARKAATKKPDGKTASPKAASPKTASAKAKASPKATLSPEAVKITMIENLIVDSLTEDKAEDVLVIDLKGKSSIADAMIIASGRSARHVSALADHVLRKIKEQGGGRAKVEGLTQGDWVLIDTGDVIVHLFRPEVRSFYGLERIWTEDGVATSGVKRPN